MTQAPNNQTPASTACQRWDWNAPAARKAGDVSAHARLYLRMMAQSDYAARLAPAVGKNDVDVLDIGAGDGCITCRCLAAGARWRAVEPNPAMGEALAAQAPALAARGIRLEHIAARWQDLPKSVDADAVFAFNIGDSHYAADALFDALAPRARRAMVWIVPAQAAPASFCLAGFLPADFYGDNAVNRQPAVERTLAQLGASRRPAQIDYIDWQCRFNFATRQEAARHFLERLDCSADSARGRALLAYLDRALQPVGDFAGNSARNAARNRRNCGNGRNGWLAACAKRSAVVRWFFS